MLLFEQRDVLRVSYERDADAPHGSPVDKVFGEMLLFEQGDVLRVSYERDADDPHGSFGG